jgi:hypothetical protein
VTILGNIVRILWKGSPNEAFLLIVGLFALGLFGFIALGITINIVRLFV